MSQNPYADAGAPSDFDAGPERTSVLAILALICSLVCFIPGLGVLALIFGIAALVAINTARGRLAGTGMAVTGVVLGLLFSAAWVAIGIGAMQFGKLFDEQLVGRAGSIVQDVQSGDFNAARAQFATDVSGTITDEQMAAFQAVTAARLGNLQRVPDGFIEWAQSMENVGPLMQRFQSGASNVVPVPAQFEQGWAVLMLRMPQDASRPGAGTLVPIVNIGVIAPDGSEYWLIGGPGMPSAAEVLKSEGTPTPDAGAPPDGEGGESDAGDSGTDVGGSGGSGDGGGG